MFCKYCGTENKDDARFCRKCGKDIFHKVNTENEFDGEGSKEIQNDRREPVLENTAEAEKTFHRAESVSSKPVKKHKNKALIIILSVLVLLILAALGAFAAVKYFEYKADEKRVSEEQNKKDSDEKKDEESKDKADNIKNKSDELKEDKTDPKDESVLPSSGSTAAEASSEVSEEVASEEETEEPEERLPEEGIHNYDVVIGKIKWTTAKKKAENAYKDGNHGEISYLVQIDSIEEFDEIINVLGNKLGAEYDSYQFFIGGRRDKDSYEYTYRYKDRYFTIPEEVADALWASGENSRGKINEPNFEYEGKAEEYIKMSKWDQSPYNWAWFDVPNNNGGFSNTAYIIEYEE